MSAIGTPAKSALDEYVTDSRSISLSEIAVHPDADFQAAWKYLCDHGLQCDSPSPSEDLPIASPKSDTPLHLPSPRTPQSRAFHAVRALNFPTSPPAHRRLADTAWRVLDHKYIINDLGRIDYSNGLNEKEGVFGRLKVIITHLHVLLECCHGKKIRRVIVVECENDGSNACYLTFVPRPRDSTAEGL